MGLMAFPAFQALPIRLFAISAQDMTTFKHISVEFSAKLSPDFVGRRLADTTEGRNGALCLAKAADQIRGLAFVHTIHWLKLGRHGDGRSPKRARGNDLSSDIPAWHTNVRVGEAMAPESCGGPRPGACRGRVLALRLLLTLKPQNIKRGKYGRLSMLPDHLASERIDGTPPVPVTAVRSYSWAMPKFVKRTTPASRTKRRKGADYRFSVCTR
jgi:hypothetical protein